jgi:hypothetical protein
VHGNMRPVSPVFLDGGCSALRRLKENVLVTDCGRAFIADVGVNALAIRAICKDPDPVPLAYSYKPREELLSGVCDQRSEVYSFACTVYAVSNPFVWLASQISSCLLV